MAITSFSPTGIRDFFVQRIAALVLVVYFIYMFFVISSVCSVDYIIWVTIFNNIFTKIFTILAFVAIFVHAWIGLWIVCSDYVKKALVFIIMMTGFLGVYAFCFLWLLMVLFLF